MDVGIVSCGIYLPRYRLRQETIAEAWSQPKTKGQKAVANFDEDSLTLAVEASLSALENYSGGGQPDTVYFGSTTFPYQEKLSSSIIATLLDLTKSTRVLDLAHSLRTGTMALLKAVEDLKAGYSQLSLVVASDCRMARPGSDLESFLGDGGAALLLGTHGIIAKIRETYSIMSDFTDIWRKDTDTYLHAADVRFAQEAGYQHLIEMTLKELLKQKRLTPNDFAKIILVPRDPRSHFNLARKLGFDPNKQLVDDLTSVIGFTGTAHPFIMLVSALEQAQPQDKILLANYGDGCNLIVLEVTDQIKRFKAILSQSFARHKELVSYPRFLQFRELIKDIPKIGSTAFTSLIMQHREQDIMMQLKARKCRRCHTVLTLRQMICFHCQAKEFDEIKLSRQGKVYTYTQEYYYPTPDPPTTMAVVDLDGGGRLLLQMTDVDADKVQIGLPVRLTYRKFSEAGGFYNYYWKCRPIE